jgi:ParB/RepB/Spo0J family partition protein
MGNKFSQQVSKAKGNKANVELTDLLVDSGSDDLIGRAKADGRFLSLSVDNFIPDPNQPRKTFDQERIDELRVSIESNGQLQPILVGERLPNGKYPIIAGERRWRAIGESKTIENVQAIIRSGDVDELHLLLMQIDENNKREQIPAVENAMGMKRVVDICKSEGKDQAYAASILNISTAQLSKHMALMSAPKMVTELSVQGETQDVEVLYNLAKASEIQPHAVAELINQWRTGELDSNLRKASKDLASETKQHKKESRKTSSKEKNDHAKEVAKTASSVRLDLDNDEFMLKVKIGNKLLSFRMEADAVISLKSDIEKNWSK